MSGDYEAATFTAVRVTAAGDLTQGDKYLYCYPSDLFNLRFILFALWYVMSLVFFVCLQYAQTKDTLILPVSTY